MRLADIAFMASLFLSRFADQVLLFLVPLVVFNLTGSVSWSGYAFFLESLPRFLAFPVCGALCDFASPYRLLRGSQVLRAVICVAGILGFMAIEGVGWLIALSALTGILTTQGHIAREVILTQAFKHHRFEKIVSQTQIADQLGMVLGPLAAAVALSWMAWTSVVVCTAVAFVAADLFMTLWWRLARPELAPPNARPARLFNPITQALSNIVHIPGLKTAIVMAAAVNLIIGVTLATAPAIVTGIQDQTEFYYGVVQAAGAAATVCILYFISRVWLSLNTLGFVGFGMICLGGFLTSMAPHASVYAVGFVLVIGFDKMFSIFLRSLRRRLIPIEDFGKTSGMMVLLNNLSQPLAGLLVGIFAATHGPATIILILSVLMAIIGGGVLVFGRKAFQGLEEQQADKS